MVSISNGLGRGMGNSVVAGFRLSAQQERVCSQTQKGARTTFVAVAAATIEGPLEPSKLREALQRTVSRHEILRTVFHQQAGVKLPFQVIRENLEPGWQEVDLS